MRFAFPLILAGFLAGTCAAQIVTGSDGSDGVFTFVADAGDPNTMTIDLSLAATQAYTLPSPVAGRGVYDPAVRAVVFKYNSVTVPAGRTIRFRNHGSGAPVVWLSQSLIIVNGTIDVSGFNGSTSIAVSNAEPGPGGYAGGRGNRPNSIGSSAGLGPGGGFLNSDAQHGNGGSHATVGGGVAPGPTYGGPELSPLIGGSGGSGASCTFCSSGTGGGGGGGGAIMLAANSVVQINNGAAVLARGGGGGVAERNGGGGAGGAIRIIAGTVEIGATAILSASGGSAGGGAGPGGIGRIRIEANTLPGSTPGADPTPSTALPQPIFPPATTPTIRLVSLDGVALPANPAGGFIFPFVDIADQFAGNVALVLELRNIATTATVQVRVTPRTAGNAQVFNATFQSGSAALSTWTANLIVPTGIDAIQVRAVLP